MSAQKLSGTVIDCGFGTTDIVPVCEGYAIPDCAQRVHLGGKDITECLMSLMRDRDVSRAQAKAIKQELCYVALDSEDEAKEATHRRPDGRVLTLCPIDASVNIEFTGTLCQNIHLISGMIHTFLRYYKRIFQ